MTELEYSLRPATARDAAPIRRLIRDVRINPMGLDWRRFVLAVDQAGNMLGCGQLKPHGANLLELASIAVVRGQRGKGIAGAIIEHLIARAPRPLYLTCRSGLSSFYERWGFRKMSQAEMPGYYRRLSRLASTFMRIGRFDEGLSVMVLK